MTEDYITWIIHKITDLFIVGIGVAGIVAVVIQFSRHV